MRLRTLRHSLAGVSCLGLAVIVRLVGWSLVRDALAANSATPHAHAETPPPPYIAADSVAAVVSRDPFRAGRRPLLPVYDPLRLAEQLAPSPPRPTLLLVGVIDGASPSAVIEGFPGVEGSRVVRVGDVVAGLAIKKVGAGRVTISGMDTTWVLEVREPWRP